MCYQRNLASLPPPSPSLQLNTLTPSSAAPCDIIEFSKEGLLAPTGERENDQNDERNHPYLDPTLREALSKRLRPVGWVVLRHQPLFVREKGFKAWLRQTFAGTLGARILAMVRALEGTEDGQKAPTETVAVRVWLRLRLVP